MTNNIDTSPSRKTSKLGLKVFASRTLPGLAVDTTVSRHRGATPRQVFPPQTSPPRNLPYESQTEEQNLVGLNIIPWSTKQRKRSLRAQLEHGESIRPGAARSVSEALIGKRAAKHILDRPKVDRSRTTPPDSLNLEVGKEASLGLPIHKRVKGLRPSPLNLTDISPSDRAIPIGIASGLRSPPETTRSGLEATTPTIVITPAKEDFGLSSSPEETPPIPPLPLFAPSRCAAVGNESSRRAAGEDARNRRPDTTHSAYTVFEEEDDQVARKPSTYGLSRLDSRTTPVTARRSRGWWNVLTSPFSAVTNASFWKSPTMKDSEQVGILGHASAMGTIRDLVIDEKLPTEEELRSAPALTESQVERVMGPCKPIPTRSFTAPGALDPATNQVNIYRVPSQGEAAAYYDRARHFPSLLLQAGDGFSKSIFEDDSPLMDVCACDHPHGAHLSIPSMAAEIVNSPGLSDHHTVDTYLGRSRDFASEHNDDPFADTATHEYPAIGSETHRAMFTSPSAESLKSAGLTRPTQERSLTQATVESQFSLAATPVVADAHVATFISPGSSCGEQREVTVTSGPGLAAATMASRSVEESAEDRAQKINAKKQFRPVQHARNDSYGLGISDEKGGLFPPQPTTLLERRRLTMDKFRQLTVRTTEETSTRRPWYRRFLWLLLLALAMLVLATLLLLVMLIPQHHRDMAVEDQWLNLTGFPPLPTGIATVIEPNIAEKQDGCVQPASLWSCAVPEEQSAIFSSGSASQPNFRFEIRFRNGTSNNSTAVTVERRSGNVASATALVGRQDISARSAWTDLLYSPSPKPPTKDDQLFLGQTTDNITAPYNGEQTPFYISLVDPASLAKRDLKARHSDIYPYPNQNSTSNSTSSSTSASTKTPRKIPKPAVRHDHRPIAADLYPLVTAQPLRLLNRGQADEHYAFYTYFDRSLYVSASNTSSSNNASSSSLPLGIQTALANASAVCTWSQTRLHVQIWTRGYEGAELLSADDAITTENSTQPNATNTASSATARLSSANDMLKPGSFPYPVTVTLDRHGGKAGRKGVYCYALDDEGKVDESAKTWVDEDRAFAGRLVNPAEAPVEETTASDDTVGRKRDDEDVYGGVDGGTGGCACRWQNWR